MKQLDEEACRRHRNLAVLRRPDDPQPLPPEPTLDAVARNFREQPIETEREVRELVGARLWDVFSDGHEVVASAGGVLDLGSFRSSGGFLADILNQQINEEKYDYLDFYMGTIWVARRADLTAVYRMIFRRLHGRQLDWIYHFPRLYVADLRPLKEVLDQPREPEWVNYSPSEALAKEEEQKEYDKNLAELRESLDEGCREAMEEAVTQPPPATVRAYATINGCFPSGWPPMPDGDHVGE